MKRIVIAVALFILAGGGISFGQQNPQYLRLHELLETGPRIDFFKGEITGTRLEYEEAKVEVAKILAEVLQDEKYHRPNSFAGIPSRTPHDEDLEIIHRAIVRFRLWNLVGPYRKLIEARSSKDEAYILRTTNHIRLLASIGYQNKDIVEFCKAILLKSFDAYYRRTLDGWGNPDRVDHVVWLLAELEAEDELKQIDSNGRQRSAIFEQRSEKGERLTKKEAWEWNFHAVSAAGRAIERAKERKRLNSLGKEERLLRLAKGILEPYQDDLRLYRETDATTFAKYVRMAIKSKIAAIAHDDLKRESKIRFIKRRGLFHLVNGGAQLTEADLAQAPLLRFTAEELAPPKRK